MTAHTAEKTQAQPQELQRRAAMAGPGYRGKRISLDNAGRNDLARRILDANLTVPGYLDGGIAWRDRRAKLFEAGDYPDKGIYVQREHIEALANRFDLPVPILIEHSESPLEIGFLTDVAMDGDELYGTIALSEEAEAIIDKNGAHALSIGLTRDLAEIREVSLVRHPRITDARIFDDTIHFVAVVKDAQVDRISNTNYSAQIEEYVRTGKMTVAQSAIASAILEQSQEPQFGTTPTNVAKLFTEFLDRQPRYRVTTELAKTPMRDHSEHLLLPEEVDFFRKNFPDVSLDEIARNRRG